MIQKFIFASIFMILISCSLSAQEMEDGIQGTQTDIQTLELMKFREYKHLYSLENYQGQPDDRYSLAWSGVASGFLPGLGQMISGQVGRGFAWFGGYMGCYIVSYSGFIIVLLNSVGCCPNPEYDNHRHDAGRGAVAAMGASMAVLGTAGAVAIHVFSILDAIKVAKIKNMHWQEVKGRTEVDMQMYPSVTYMNTFDGVKAAPGVTLAVRF